MGADHKDAKGPAYPEAEIASEMEAWFSVEGDVDDFIYYWETRDTRGE